jgi:hypothetical protein
MLTREDRRGLARDSIVFIKLEDLVQGLLEVLLVAIPEKQKGGRGVPQLGFSARARWPPSTGRLSQGPKYGNPMPGSTIPPVAGAVLTDLFLDVRALCSPQIKGRLGGLTGSGVQLRA